MYQITSLLCDLLSLLNFLSIKVVLFHYKQRIDGRETYDYRKLRISFGVDRGHCEVQLGRTRYGY